MQDEAVSGGVVINIMIEPLLTNLLCIFLQVMKTEAEPLSDGVAACVGG